MWLDMYCPVSILVFLLIRSVGEYKDMCNVRVYKILST